MKIITHLDLSQQNRYQAVQVVGHEIVIEFGSTMVEAIKKCLKTIVKKYY